MNPNPLPLVSLSTPPCNPPTPCSAIPSSVVVALDAHMSPQQSRGQHWCAKDVVTIYLFSLPKHLLSYLWHLSYLIHWIHDSTEPWHHDTVTIAHLVIFLLLSCNGALIIRPLTLVYKYCSSSCIFPSFELKFIHTETHSFLLSA